MTLPIRVKTWWTILRICLEERLVYRGDFALGTLMRFLPIVTQIFLWFAIFEAVKDTRGADDVDEIELGGYRYTEFVAYYLLTMLSRAFSSMPGLASGIARQIRDGEIKKYLIQPVDMLGFMFLGRIAHKVAYYSVAIGPFALVFFLCRGMFRDLPAEAATRSVSTVAAYLAALIMGFVLGYFLEAAIGLIGFWWLEVTSILFIYMLFSFFLSGHMFPLDMLPEPWLTMVDLLPLKYLAYFPAAVFLGKVTGPDLIWGLCVEFFWILFFVGLSRWFYLSGIKRYSGFGG
ncbi:MAG: ABC-2 family transporter protein [Pirellulaceae bacterium]|jgi:ABC-2 type transport system permease protein|nr:ABC-2 family transporter protein [Pirellulaceae bacterium]